jgi:hypothetical protein
MLIQIIMYVIGADRLTDLDNITTDANKKIRSNGARLQIQ